MSHVAVLVFNGTKMRQPVAYYGRGSYKKTGLGFPSKTRLATSRPHEFQGRIC